jgi:hypothetical protein
MFSACFGYDPRIGSHRGQRARALDARLRRLGPAEGVGRVLRVLWPQILGPTGFDAWARPGRQPAGRPLREAAIGVVRSPASGKTHSRAGAQWRALFGDAEGAATGNYPQGRFAEDKHLRGLAYRIVFVTLRPSAVASTGQSAPVRLHPFDPWNGRRMARGGCRFKSGRHTLMIFSTVRRLDLTDDEQRSGS